LALDTLHLAFGIWQMAFGIWQMALGIWNLELLEIACLRFFSQKTYVRNNLGLLKI
jgi:hypothetical protein